MTQSGQGEEHSQRVAREGIVLPSDGGEPLLPGMTGASGRPAPVPAAPPAPAPNPTGGQAWGLPWGPDTNQDQDDYQGHYQAPAQPQPQPQPQASGGWPTPPDAQQHQQWGDQGQFHPQQQPLPQQQPEQQAPSAPAWNNDPGASGGWAQQPGYGEPGYGAQPTPGAPYSVHAAHADPGPESAPYPPAAPQYEQQAHQQYGPYGGASLPPVEDATQFIPPVPGTPGPVAEPATQYLPPVAAHAPAPPHVNEAATQFLPPVGPGAMPPQTAAEATTYLGRVPQAAPGGSDADATQYIPPVPGGSYGIPQGGADDRQPPSAFDNLFRSGPGAETPAGATQQMPRIQPQQPAPAPYGQQAPYAAQQAPYGFQAPHDMDGEQDRGGRRSRMAVIAALGVGIVVLGIGAGAMLSSSGGDSDKDAGNKTVAATSAAPEESEAPAADPAKAQAVELDKLLADSNNSRDTVIRAVSDVKSCNNLGQAAADLRGAAQQRGELVTRLSTLAVDKLPEHAGLTDALTKAWQASQAADNHYAAWADQTAGKNGCKKGQARSTGQTQKGNQQSGVATEQKSRAAELWNTIAKTYDLTERQSTQL
ncbi:hypothetical protein [Streptomyces sp. NBC_00459]|uniref:hypothetical protein n=1 Tax=Streptomyces sp. NBC_00459 TaxID=2975749 RepID=UPI002E170028